jgi:hypothetical protein
VKLSVVVCDFGAALHMGASIEWKFRTFELPEEMADYIRSAQGCNCTVTFALADNVASTPAITKEPK